MNDKKDKRAIGALIIGACVGLVLWVILLALRTAGYMDMHWALVLTGFVWLTWLVYALMGLAALCVYAVMRARRWWRRVNSPDWDEYAERYGTVRLPGETDEQLRARIIKIITYEKPTEALSGTTLDMRAWLDFQIRRKPGETDEELRARCMNEADNELANGPK